MGLSVPTLEIRDDSSVDGSYVCKGFYKLTELSCSTSPSESQVSNLFIPKGRRVGGSLGVREWVGCGCGWL